MLSTGVAKLDEALKGGIGEGASVLIEGAPGMDKMVFGLQAAYSNLEKGKQTLYFVNNKLPGNVRSFLTRTSWKAKTLEKLEFIDGFSTHIGFSSGERYAAKEPKLESASEAVISALSQNCNSLAVFDSLSTLLAKEGENKTLEALKSWQKLAKKNKITSFYLLTDWEMEKTKREKLRGLFDYVLRLDSVEEKILLRNYISVKKAPKKFEDVSIPFRVGMEGVAIYVPKLLVTGPFSAGKSSFVHAVSTRAVSVDRLGTTVALDHGYIDYGGLEADLFGTPGQERFEFMLDILNRDTFGVILVVDSTDPKTFARAQDMASHVLRYGIPYAIAANKQDVKGALKPEEIRAQMKLPKEIPILPTSARTKKGCLEAVKVLVDLVIKKNVKTS
ncbi:MAG: ATPase domain-containing protein [Candidatus Micrarchaeota archaeon]